MRSAAAVQLKRFRGDSMAIGALQTALEDSSYDVLANAIRSLAKADSSHALPLLKKYLEYPSFRNRIHNAVLNLLGPIDSAQAVTIALTDAQYGHDVTTRFTSLGTLRKYGKGKPDVLALYQSLLSDKDDGIRSNAARTLGEIGEEPTIATLDRIANDKDNAASDTAKESIEKIKKRVAGKKKESTH